MQKMWEEVAAFKNTLEKLEEVTTGGSTWGHVGIHGKTWAQVGARGNKREKW